MLCNAMGVKGVYDSAQIGVTRVHCPKLIALQMGVTNFQKKMLCNS